MIETCTKRRLLVAIAAALLFSAIIIILENRLTGDSQTQEVISLETLREVGSGGGGSKSKAATATATTRSPSSPESSNYVLDSECWKTETVTVRESCVSCTSFQRNVFPACAPSGFYDRVFCTTSQTLTNRPCHSHPEAQEEAFNHLMISSILVTVVFSLLAKWRQAILDRKAAYRIQQQLGHIP